ncbi:MAG: hypothetical protein CFE24_13310 [Flavobacterium sp. BFFFF2]|nr:MAG: hypothetical protein CFE24_13310 [Flavobacterium sp. BFFFF2]
MRILQYLFLIVMLLLLGAIAFILTEDPNYNIQKTRVVPYKAVVAQEFISELNYWNLFMDWPSAKPENKSQQTLQGLFFDHNTQEHPSGLFRLKVRSAQDVSGKVVLDNQSMYYKWHITPTKTGQALVRLRAHGEVSFQTRFLAFFNGGVKLFVEEKLTQSLENLDRTIRQEWVTAQYKTEGFVHFKMQHGLAKKWASSPAHFNKNLQLLKIQMVHLFQKNKIPQYANPILRYDVLDKNQRLVRFTVGVPTIKQVFVADESDVCSYSIPHFTAIKVRLTGYYDHIEKAMNKAKAFAEKEHYYPNTTYAPLVVFRRDVNTEIHPSRWVTDVYWPVYPKHIYRAAAPLPSVVTDSTAVQVP